MNKQRFNTRFFALMLLLAVSLLPSCRRAVEKARQNIRIEAVEKVERHALSGIDLTLRVHNGTGYKLVLNNALLTLWLDGSRVGDVILREEVAIERHTTQSAITRWKFKIDNPLALYVLVRRIHANDFSQIEVSYAVNGRGGPAPIKISSEMIPLSDFLHIFGVRIEDIKTYLSE
ncbi:MAG: hypothetical protein RRZ83_04060 [Alistipes sp.]